MAGENSVFVPRDLNGTLVQQRRGDGYVNATQMCKAAGKQWNDYWRLGSTSDYIAELSSETGIPVSLLSQAKKGGKDEQGTWVHPDVAIHLAQWCSPKFAVQVSRWVRELLTAGHVDIRPVGIDDDPILAKLDAIRDVRLRQIATEKELAEQRLTVHRALNTANAALAQAEGNHGFFAILGYCKLHNRELSREMAADHGKKLTAICRSRGINPGKVTHPTWGTINTYPESLLQEYFGDPPHG